jgi:hypothetical protein
MNATTVRNGVIAVLLIDAVMVACVVGVSVSWRAGLFAGAAAIALPLILVPAAMMGIGSMSRWWELARLYPRVEASERAGRGRIASIAVRYRWLGINNCVKLVVDEDYLHVSVVLPGLKPLSVPWAAVEELVEHRLSTQLRLVEGPSIWVPKWAGEREVEVRGVEVVEDGGVA